uniref:2-amino-3-carboxymuconate-6-semialdehyde decarboxylase n=1 Tax=Caenorhabditis japonica TaxID=281687 RepID=A0A8R1I591_CAEJA
MHSWDGRLNKYWMPWLVGMPSETAQAICSVLMGNILQLFPRLRFCFAHGGGSYPIIRGRVAHGYHVRPDLCATDCKTPPKELDGLLWTDSLVHDPKALELLVSTVGKVRIEKKRRENSLRLTLNFTTKFTFWDCLDYKLQTTKSTVWDCLYYKLHFFGSA